jgi:hypothetical protein
MRPGARDPYQTLGIPPGAPDAEVRKAYRRLVQKYHPDHNGGSEESERRFEEVQEAYARIRERRQAPPRQSSPPPPRRRTGAASAPPPPPPTFDPDIEARAAALERELKEAQLARERAREAARQAAAEAARRAAAKAAADNDVEAGAGARAGASRPGRPSDEELGYIKTDDSFTKILADARSELSGRFSEAQGHPVVRRVSDLIDELDELASKLTGDRHKPKAG